MPNSTVLDKSLAPAARVIPHAVSPGLWALAWKRLSSDRVAMVSLAIVAAFLVMMLLSGTGLIASDWGKEVGVNYAPPSFVGADTEAAAPGSTPSMPAPQATATPAVEYKSSVIDPLADVLAELRGEEKPVDTGVAQPAPAGESAKSIDPLAEV